MHAKCDGLDELALVTMRLASAHAYLCPKHRRTGPGLAYTAGDLTMIPIKDKPPQLPANPQKQPQAAHSAPSQEANAGLDMTLSSIFGLRVGADGRLLYGVEYEHTGSTCAKALQWQVSLFLSPSVCVCARAHSRRLRTGRRAGGAPHTNIVMN